MDTTEFMFVTVMKTPFKMKAMAEYQKDVFVFKNFLSKKNGWNIHPTVVYKYGNIFPRLILKLSLFL